MGCCYLFARLFGNAADHFTDNEIINLVQRDKNSSDSSEEENLVEAPTVPTLREARQACEILKNYLQYSENQTDVLDAVVAIENVLFVKQFKQLTLDDFVLRNV